MANQGKDLKPKEAEIAIRRVEVERLHIRGATVAEIAQRLGVDSRTVSRDIQQNRLERVQMLKGSREAKDWLRAQVADTMAFLDSAKKEFCHQADTFKTEAGRSRALAHAVEIEFKRIDTIKGLLWSLYDLEMGGANLSEDA